MKSYQLPTFQSRVQKIKKPALSSNNLTILGAGGVALVAILASLAWVIFPANPDRSKPIKRITPTTLDVQVSSIQHNHKISAILVKHETGQNREEKSSAGLYEFSQLDPGPATIYIEYEPKVLNYRQRDIYINRKAKKASSLVLNPGHNSVTVGEASRSIGPTINVMLNGMKSDDILVFARPEEIQKDIRKDILAKGVVSAPKNAFTDVQVLEIGEDGTGTFEEPMLGKWNLMVTPKNGDWTWIYPSPIDLSERPTLTIEIETHAGQILVLNAENLNPMADTELHFYTNFSEPGFKARTDSFGYVSLNVPLGRYGIDLYPRSRKKPQLIKWDSDIAYQEVALLTPAMQ